MCWLLLTSAYSKSQAFQFATLCQRAGAQEAEREHVQKSWAEVSKGVSHTTQCHAQYKLGEAGWEPAIAAQEQQVVSTYMVHHLVFLCFIPLSPLFYLYLLVLVALYFILFQLLNYSWLTRFTFFPKSLLHQVWGE